MNFFLKSIFKCVNCKTNVNVLAKCKFIYIYRIFVEHESIHKPDLTVCWHD